MSRKHTSVTKKVAEKSRGAVNVQHDPPEAFEVDEIRGSPLKLANFTATLKMAGIIPYPLDDTADPSELESMNVPGQLIRQALGFLATCADFLHVLKKADELESEENKFSQRLEKLREGSMSRHVSVEDVLKAAGLDRLKLTTDELRKLDIREKWTDLTPRIRAIAVFRYLSRPEFQGGINFPDANTGSFVSGSSFFFNMGDIAVRNMAESGIDSLALSNGNLFLSLCQAQQIRMSKNATERAHRSHKMRAANDARVSSEAKSRRGKSKQKTRGLSGRFSE